MKHALSGAVLLAAYCWAGVSLAAPDLSAARDVVSRWIEARQRGQLDAYLKLYGAGLRVVRHKAGGAEEKLDLAAHTREAQEAFGGRGAAVDVYVDQYAREKDGVITAAFRAISSTSDAQETLLILKLGEEGGALKILREESTPLRPGVKAGVPIGVGQTGVAPSFPKGFSSVVSLRCARCDQRDECPCELRAGEARLPLGVFVNDPEGEFMGNYYGALRAVPLVSFGPVAGAVLVVVENGERDGKGEDRGAVFTRRGTLIGKGPAHPMLWTGDLLAFSKSRSVRYEVRPGKQVEQRIAVSGHKEGRPTSCRLSLLSEGAQAVPRLVYGCGLQPGAETGDLLSGSAR